MNSSEKCSLNFCLVCGITATKKQLGLNHCHHLADVMTAVFKAVFTAIFSASVLPVPTQQCKDQGVLF